MAILLLISLLDAGNYRVRDAATLSLSHLCCPLLLPTLEHVERTGSPEARTRANRVLSLWWSANGDRVAAGLGKLPWMTATEAFCFEAHNCLLGAALGAGARPGGPEWHSYREATRLAVAYLLRGRQPVAGFLLRLWEEEAAWKKANGYPQ